MYFLVSIYVFNSRPVLASRIVVACLCLSFLSSVHPSVLVLERRSLNCFLCWRLHRIMEYSDKEKIWYLRVEDSPATKNKTALGHLLYRSFKHWWHDTSIRLNFACYIYIMHTMVLSKQFMFLACVGLLSVWSAMKTGTWPAFSNIHCFIINSHFIVTYIMLIVTGWIKFECRLNVTHIYREINICLVPKVIQCFCCTKYCFM